MKIIKNFTPVLLGCLMSLSASQAVQAANTHTILDGQEIVGFNSGYDVREVTFTLNADFSLVAEIFTYGVPGDADGDGDPNLSSDANITDDPGVGPTEVLQILMECGATDPNAACVPNVRFIYTNNALTALAANGANITPYVTFEVLLDRYVLTIADLMAFKTALGIPTNTVNFGAFSFVASVDDKEVDDMVPDTGTCEFVSLDPPEVAVCDLQLSKTASVDTIGPILDPVGDEDDRDHNHHSWEPHDGSCPQDDPYTSVTCGCKGKVTDLTLMYTGPGLVNVNVDRVGPFATDLFDGMVMNGAPFTVTGSDFGPKGFRGTLGVAISLSVDGQEPVEIHTSCSEPIGEGMVVGDFVVLSGNSRKLSVPLCSLVPEECPANQQVTYTYTVTNNGTDVTGLLVSDDQLLEPVGGPVDLAAGGMVMFQQDACLYETTTNIAQAEAVLGNGEVCVSNSASVTVELLPPPDDDPCHGYGDSGYDHDHSGDSDDSDWEPTGTECGGSEPPPADPISYEGCDASYWKRNRREWGAYSPGDRYDAIFGVDASGNKSLMRSLKGHGQHASSKALGREAVAALLNASSPSVNYLFTPGEVIEIVVDAYENRDFDTAWNILREQNSKGCSLGGH